VAALASARVGWRGASGLDAAGVRVGWRGASGLDAAAARVGFRRPSDFGLDGAEVSAASPERERPMEAGLPRGAPFAEEGRARASLRLAPSRVRKPFGAPLRPPLAPPRPELPCFMCRS
jgi:hypothetical protein